MMSDDELFRRHFQEATHMYYSSPWRVTEWVLAWWVTEWVLAWWVTEWVLAEEGII